MTHISGSSDPHSDPVQSMLNLWIYSLGGGVFLVLRYPGLLALLGVSLKGRRPTQKLKVLQTLPSLLLWPL